MFRLPRTVKVAPHLDQFSGIWAFVNKDDENKQDLNLKGSQIEFTARKTLALPTPKGTFEYAFTPHSFEQFAKTLNIPAKYLGSCPITGRGSMQDQISARMDGLLNKSFLMRLRNTKTDDGLSGMVRAILPENYAVFDNRHLVQACQTAITQTGMKFSIQMTNVQDPRSIEQRIMMRFVQNQQFDVKAPSGVGDPHQIGFHCLSSEVGDGDIRVDALVYRLLCTNGLMGWGDSEVLRQRHSGFMPHEMTPRFQEAVLASVRQEDAIKDLLERKYTELVGRDPTNALMLMAAKMRVSDYVKDTAVTVLQKNVKSEYTKFDIMQAFTETAQQLPLMDRIKLEMSVGRMMLGGGKPAIRENVPAEADDISN